MDCARFSAALWRAGIGFEFHHDEWLLMLDGSGFRIVSGRRAIAVPNFGRKDC